MLGPSTPVGDPEQKYTGAVPIFRSAAACPQRSSLFATASSCYPLGRAQQGTMLGIRRRDFITLLGGAAAGWPLAARAQQPIPVIGLLNASSPESVAHLVAAFRQGLSETGYVEGRNVAIEYRWAEGRLDRLPPLAADLVGRQVAVISAFDTPSAIAAKAATTTIPITFAVGSDPVKLGLVTSLNRPGGNISGVSYLNVTLAAKLLGLLHELVPGAARIGVLDDPSNSAISELFVSDVRAAASAIGQQIEVLHASNGRDIDALFASLAQKPVDALLVSAGSLFFDRRVQLVTLAAFHRVPAIYPWREAAVAGGLMSYGTSLADARRLAGAYTGRILKGEKPADLPVMQSSKFELVINLNTAKAFGLSFPTVLLTIADNVIE
jgi:putative tryptophan/tyrosine transport system substrate-binding protein